MAGVSVLREPSNEDGCFGGGMWMPMCAGDILFMCLGGITMDGRGFHWNSQVDATMREDFILKWKAIKRRLWE